MRMISSTAAAGRHAATAIVEAALIVAIVVALVFALAVTAGRTPGGAGRALAKDAVGSWIELAQVGAKSASSVQPSLGDYVSFASGYPKTIKNPRILVNCYQEGNLVFGMGGAVDYDFLLGGGGSIWKANGGAARCDGILYYYGFHAGKQTFNELARTSFSAGG